MATLGINSKLFYNTATFGTPTWVEITIVRDLNVESAWNMGDASTRVSPVIQEEPTQLKLGISCKILSDGSVIYLLLSTRHYARTMIDIMCLDGSSATNGVEGVRYEAKIGSWTQDQGAGNVNYRDVTFAPCASANPPKSVAVSAGAPVFTTIA